MKDNILRYKPEREDRMIQCVAANGMVRIAFVDATNLVQEASRVHHLSRVATAAMGRQLMMTVIMAADLKGENDLVSTIIKGDGPAGSMICTGNSRLEVKGSLTNGDIELPLKENGKLDVGGFVGHTGKLSVVSDLGLKEPMLDYATWSQGRLQSILQTTMQPVCKGTRWSILAFVNARNPARCAPRRACLQSPCPAARMRLLIYCRLRARKSCISPDALTPEKRRKSCWRACLESLA